MRAFAILILVVPGLIGISAWLQEGWRNLRYGDPMGAALCLGVALAATGLTFIGYLIALQVKP